MINKGPLEKFIELNSHNLTFLEAYKKTKIKINITITDSIHQKTRLCNYITTPNLYVWSAAMASCSLPFVYGSSKLKYKSLKKDYYQDEKKFFDGSIGCDLPMKQVSMLYNISNTIVCQCNPYLVPFLATSERVKFHKRYFFYRLKEKIFETLGGELTLRLSQLRNNGLLPKFLQMPVNLGKPISFIN